MERLVGVMGMRRVDMSEIRISAGEFLAVKSSSYEGCAAWRIRCMHRSPYCGWWDAGGAGGQTSDIRRRMNM